MILQLLQGEGADPGGERIQPAQTDHFAAQAFQQCRGLRKCLSRFLQSAGGKQMVNRFLFIPLLLKEGCCFAVRIPNLGNCQPTD